ncbi:Protein DAY-LENGTH-DEPENDENT DELAYED-GREENING 1 [Ranunculus cassubicifolius]
MFLMSTSISMLLFPPNTFPRHKSSSLITRTRSRNRGRLITYAAAQNNNDHRRKRPWWKKFFLDDDGNWFGLKDDDMIEEYEYETEEIQGSEEEKFEAWKRRAEAISELREAQEDTRNAESRKWEDWLVPAVGGASNHAQDWTESIDDPNDDPNEDLADNVRALLFGKDKDDFTYEDRVFQYASTNSVKFLAILVVIPCLADFVAHDYLFMPFLDRYVKTVPLAAEFFDVRRSQKLQMVNTLKVEKARFRFEVEIGKSPPLSDEEVWLELREKALELREEWRLENRRAFANILSDMVFGIILFLLLVFNQSKVALLKFTGYKLINNVSDTGKAFLIILITDIFLGYHSESGWETLLEIIVDHYGVEVDHAVITIFICLVPVVIDACVKLWLFKYLPRLSPKVSTIFQEMKRH